VKSNRPIEKKEVLAALKATRRVFSLDFTNEAGTPPPPLEGKSLMPVFAGQQIPERLLFWEHEGNSAVREGK
jgi:arylsulfatase